MRASVFAAAGFAVLTPFGCKQVTSPTVSLDAAAPLARTATRPTPSDAAPPVTAAAPPNDPDAARRGIYCLAFPERHVAECWARLAVMSGDPAQCPQFDDNVLRGCVVDAVRASGDARPCRTLSEPRDVFECVMGSALHAQDAAGCDVLDEGAAFEQRCARAGHPAERCAMFRAPDLGGAKKACVAAVKGDAAACDALPAATGARTGCIEHVALKTKSLALCKKLHDAARGDVQFQNDENRCLENVAIALADKKACDAIPRGKRHPPGEVSFEICLMAAAASDPSACDRVGELELAARRPIAAKVCRDTRAVRCGESGVRVCGMLKNMGMRDPKLCDALTDPMCRLTVAYNTGNRAACEGLDARMKTACEKLSPQ